MTRTVAEWCAWARERRAAFESVPLSEQLQGERVQVGFSLTLYLAAPMDAAAGPERSEAIRRLWAELNEFAQAVAPEDQRTARVDIEQAPRVVLRPENDFQPQVGLTFHLFPRGVALSAIADEDQRRMTELKRRLLGFGLKQAKA
ncbi:MAG TPA: hypothetical protein VEQ10_20115 [Vicinamibacteria bacterium]|nr:hypothetical protein [Vicinamibacteria bacterium]